MPRPEAATPKAKKNQVTETPDLSITQSTDSEPSHLSTLTNVTESQVSQESMEAKIDAILMGVRQLVKTTTTLDQQIQLAKKAGKF